MPRFFNFASSTNRKPNRRRHSQSRRLRGIESLERREMMTAVPGYSSLAGAPVTIYLDFDGHHENQWGEVTHPEDPASLIWNNLNTPVFSLDGDQNFSSTELDYIHKIWQTVAEDFSIFNVNVTTIAPPASELGHTIRVCIGGGSDDWYQLDPPAGGISVMGSFKSQDHANVVYVFSGEFSNARQIGDCASQEVGHSLGLDHQRIWNKHTGDIIEEYNPGTLESAPIMGVPYNSQRGLWWYDPEAENGWTKQDDINLILNNNIGVVELRSDDHGSSFQTATHVTSIHGAIHGIITHNGQGYGPASEVNDRDAFNVTLPGASVMKNWAVTVEVDAYTGNLDAKLQVYKYDGPAGKGGVYAKPPQLVGTFDSASELGAFFNLGQGGPFMIVVSSHGDYGDLGQYTLRFNEVNRPLLNTNPVSLPPIIDVICDPLNPVVLPGRTLGQTFVNTSQLNLNSLSVNAKPASNFTTESPKLVTTGVNASSPGLDALDQAFAQFGKKINTF
jgi:hypothetical protein